MKKSIAFFLSITVSASLLAGGIVTNTNQSAGFTRFQAYDAMIGVDGTYFNPAGLTLLPNNGLFFSVNNQTIGQTVEIKSNYQFLTDYPEATYEGKVSAPLFPGVYAAFKTEKFVFSAGFNPIGGGGGAEYQDGLPSFEMSIANLVPLLRGNLAPLDQAIETATGSNPGFSNITGYSYDVYFKGSSVFFGYQANASYAITDKISVAIGGRYVTAKNTYQGHLNSIMIVPPAAYGPAATAGNYLRFVASQVQQMDPTTAATLEGTALYLDAQTSDKEVDVIETGSGFTPVISVNFAPSDKLNLAFKYEHKTKLELETEVVDEKDGNGLYTDGKKNRADMPAQLVAGATMKATDKLLVSGGFHMYFDKSADYGKTTINALGETVALENSDILDNTIEVALGTQYNISEKLAASIGWLHVFSGAKEEFQSDMDFSLSSNTIGGGFGYTLNPMIELNLGGSYTKYIDGEKNFNALLGANPIPTVEKYHKNTWIIAIGININLGAGK